VTKHPEKRKHVAQKVCSKADRIFIYIDCCMKEYIISLENELFQECITTSPSKLILASPSSVCQL
jgi:hypothetical protein